MAQTTVALNTPTDQPARRALVGTIVATDILGSAPSLTAAETDPHLAWEREAAVLRAQARAPGTSWGDDADASIDTLTDRIWALGERIAATPATTPAGIAAQIRLAIVGFEEGMGDSEEQTLRSAEAALQTLAGRALA